MKTISRYIMTLALLLTAVTGAWAQSLHSFNDLIEEIGSGGNITLQYDYYKYESGSTIEISASGVIDGNGAIIDMEGANISHVIYISADNVTIKNLSIINYTGTGDAIYFAGSGGSVYNIGYDVALNRVTTANTWTLSMPASDVLVTPIYAKTAAFATTGTEPEVTTLLPAAAEGVIAGTDAPLIVEGTVAFAGQSTEVTQGTVMYAVTAATATEAPALTSSDWKNTVPTAKDIADDGAEVKVWYYIQGADAPQGVAATLDNTFNNSDICTTPLTVTVLSNKFDLALKPANANTIDATQASKGTVTVAGTDMTSTLIHSQQDGTDTLKSVKMGSEVKLKAKPGYKFRKVEVKKVMKPVTLKDALVNGATVVITYAWTADAPYTTTFTFTNDNGSFNGIVTGSDAEHFSKNMSQDGTNLTFVADNAVDNKGDVNITFYTESNGYYINSKGEYFRSFTISVDGTDLTSQLERLK